MLRDDVLLDSLDRRAIALFEVLDCLEHHLFDQGRGGRQKKKGKKKNEPSAPPSFSQRACLSFADGGPRGRAGTGPTTRPAQDRGSYRGLSGVKRAGLPAQPSTATSWSALGIQWRLPCWSILGKRERKGARLFFLCRNKTEAPKTVSRRLSIRRPSATSYLIVGRHSGAVEFPGISVQRVALGVQGARSMPACPRPGC